MTLQWYRHPFAWLRGRARPPRPREARLTLECLEERAVPASLTPLTARAGSLALAGQFRRQDLTPRPDILWRPPGGILPQRFVRSGDPVRSTPPAAGRGLWATDSRLATPTITRVITTDNAIYLEWSDTNTLHNGYRVAINDPNLSERAPVILLPPGARSVVIDATTDARIQPGGRYNISVIPTGRGLAPGQRRRAAVRPPRPGRRPAVPEQPRADAEGVRRVRDLRR